ncbi:hypothetical protein SSX86_003880 [Deinandra increscens subsp. villosa]|uniref:Uncharacterized protein n=1 Tax=Deinandra increscens subsp. villosa TaxID=3103831 RepID=A0AAP0HAD6_9ASTR
MTPSHLRKSPQASVLLRHRRFDSRNADSLRFCVDTEEDIGTDIAGFAAHTIKICLGVTKVMVRAARGGGDFGDDGNELKLDLWRFRLPESTQPELATAAFSDGELGC